MTGEPRHVPLRRCVGCGKQRPQAELIRLAALPSDGIVVDRERRFGGRGAYLCSGANCVKRALARGSIPRALRQPGSGTAWAERILDAGT
jgi:predicted RNA-binding protein YlxR (DUF448 family)